MKYSVMKGDTMEKEKINTIQNLLSYVNITINKKFICKKGIRRVNQSAIMILLYLMNEPKKTLKEISSSVGLANSTVSGIIDNLVEIGYVERIQDESDRRRVLISATQKALEKREELEKKHEDRIGTLIKQASDEELDEVINGLKKFADILKRREKQ